MNTEINFLEKQPNKYIAPLFFVVMFAVLLVIVVTLLLFQKNYYATNINSQHSKISEIEILLLEHQKEGASEQRLKQLQQEIISLQAEKVPNIALYKQVLGLLSSTDQLTYFEFMNESQFVVEAEFETLENIADYLMKLLEKTYILDTDLTQVSSIESAYQTTLTIDVDIDLLKEELGLDD